MNVKNKEGKEKDVGFYRSLHRATLKGEWEKAKEFLEQNQDAVSADITGEGDTILMVAVSSHTKKRNHFVKKLLEFIAVTSSHADLTVSNDKDNEALLPLHVAALLCYKNMVLYLMDVTDIEEYEDIFVGSLIMRGLYDVPPKLEESTYNCSGGDFENPTHCHIYVPWIKDVRGIKWKNDQAIQLVRHLCIEYEKLDFSEARYRVGRSVFATTTYGIPEVVEEILSIFPEAIYSKNEKGQNLFQIAILNRQRDVFKLIYQLSDKSIMNYLLAWPDSSGNTSLDLVACLKKKQSSKLKAAAAGAVLQMQLELQWFKTS
ncbi:uncharacterized protein LOC132314251 [Cornus florida]|uniref:uncharacterized protein LOC132314251 n=1 Tax=Cornus florida TaxID=4283 RepID=UPI002898ED7B|nr:uncharacterized protein LOC132314251 [Cornus florida]